MIRICILALVFFCSPLAANIQLKEKLAEARPGSYMVLEQNKTFTFFHIRERFDHVAVIEEVSIPAASFARRPMPWKEWFESGAPGHTAWVMSQVNLNTGAFEETFSFTHQGWVDMSEANPFLTTLLNLRFQEISFEDRRRVGLPPGHNKADLRPLWIPRLVVNGCTVPHSSFFAYKARWPSDGTELSRKVIEIYLPAYTEETGAEAWLPTYFPYWLEVEGKIGSAKVRVVDSGVDAHSPQSPLPKRTPQLIGDVEVGADTLLFHLKSPPYYREFMIFAEECDTLFGHLSPLPCTTCIEGESVLLTVNKSEFHKLAENSDGYRFVISPKENPSIALETRISLQTSPL